MKIAIFTLTKGGREQAQRLKKYLPQAAVYSFPKAGESLGATVAQCFQEYRLLIFIMATGIVVRTIAPLLKHKSIDPAIIVMDEAGRNIISLLSGHIGGANYWALKLAELINANPVITTASDIKGVKAVDTFAMEHDLVFVDWSLAKEITAYLVNGGKIGLYWVNRSFQFPDQYVALNSIEEFGQYPYGLMVTDQENLALERGILQLFPKSLVVGVGCRKNTVADQILYDIKTALKGLGKSICSIQKLVTVDVKQHEPGLIRAAEALGVPLEIISREAIRKVEYLFESSEFVKRTIGVGSVSGPCAFIGSNGGEMLLTKMKGKGTTLSVAERTLEV
ncbi:cobalt-precorrin 5A hydrolase [Alkaliphilus crotonatoxidans]